MFASRVTKTVPLPSDPSATVTIKRLGFLQKQAAQKAAQRESMKGLREMGGAEFLKELNALKESDPDAVAAVAADPLSTHDLLMVLIGGITAWSAPEPVSKAAIEDLDQADAEFLGREILALSTKAAPGNAA